MKWIILFVPWLAIASEDYFSINRIQSISLTGGNWMENYRQTQGSRNGDVKGFEFNPYLTVLMDYKISERFTLVPEFGYVIRRTINSQTTKDHFFIRSDIQYRYNDWLSFSGGRSMMIKSYSGNGGEEELNNGSSTENFYAANERRSSINQTLDFGIAGNYQDFTLKFQTYIYSINDADQRMITYSLALHYPLWENIQ